MLSLACFVQRKGRQALCTNDRAVAENKVQSESLAGAEAAAANGGQDDASSLPSFAVQDTNSVDDSTAATADVEHTPSHLEVPQELQRIRAAAAAQSAARCRRLREPLRIRLQGLAGWLERFIVRQKATSALLFAFCTFLWRIFGEVGLLAAEPPKPTTTEFAAGHVFLNREVDAALTRASWPATGTKLGVNHFKSKIAAGVPEDNADVDDDALALQEALRIADSQQHPVRRAELLSQGYAALGRIHSSRGHYYDMIQAMTLALRFGADTGDRESVSNFQLMLGHLEMNHHRYSQAGARFKDALQTATSNAAREEAFVGLGWSLLTQGHDNAAGGRFVEALGWTPVLTPLNLSTSAAAVARVAVGGSCTAHHDGRDGIRVLSLAGLALAHARLISGQQFTDGGSASIILNCAVFLFHGIPTDQQEAHIWRALGNARLVLAEANAARRYHQRAALRGHRDPALAAANPNIFSCATAADLPACSHNALHLGLVDFSSGNTALGIRHVELLLSRTRSVPAEAAEWLIRFAQAHSWTQAGRNFAAFLLERAEQLRKSKREAR